MKKQIKISMYFVFANNGYFEVSKRLTDVEIFSYDCTFSNNEDYVRNS